MDYTLDNKNIFGLDIGDRSLKLVQLKPRGKKLALSSYNDLSLPPDLIINGEIKQPDKLNNLLNQLIKSVRGAKINTKKIITVLPETKTFIKVIEISSTSEENLSELVQEEIKNHIPFDPNEIYLDWQVLQRAKDMMKLLVGAAPKDIVDSYTSFLEKSGLTSYVLEIEAAAIIRSLIGEKMKQEAEKKAKIIIDFGAVRTGLIVYDQGTVQFTISLPISGNKITETIQKTLDLDWQKAEKAKIICGLDQTKCEGALLKILSSAINNLATQIKKAAVFYKTNYPAANAIEEIIICGGGANFIKIDKVLSEKLKLPVKIGNPIANIVQTKKLAIPANKLLSYTTAIGLALRAWQKII